VSEIEASVVRVRPRIRKWDLLHLGVDAVYGAQPRPRKGT